MPTPKKSLKIKMDINTADALDLQLLPGVGPALARAIIADRTAAGPFASVDDLARVSGVGAKILARIREALSETPTTVAAAPTALPTKAPISPVALPASCAAVTQPKAASQAPTVLPVALPASCAAVVQPQYTPADTLPANVLRFPCGNQAPKRPSLFADVRHERINAPDGWSWTQGQIAAIHAIRQHLRTNRGKPFVLKGYAGTGKTTLLVEALRTFSPPIMLAPTHKARSVLEPKADKLNGTTHTVAGWLGYSAVVDPETGEEKFERKVLSPSLEAKRYDPNKPVILDEVSMVDEKRWGEILEIVSKYKLQFIAMGDPLQLPPVGEDMSPAFKIESGVELTEVMRSQGALTDAVLGVRERIEQDVPPVVKTSFKDDVSEIRVLHHKDEVIRHYLHALHHGQDAMIVAWTNKVVDWCNREIRKVIANGDDRPFVPGELLVLTQPYTLGIPDFDEDGEAIMVDRTLYTETRVQIVEAVRGVHPEWGDQCWILKIAQLGFDASASSLLDRRREADDDDAQGTEATFHPVYAYDSAQSVAILRKMDGFRRDHAKARADNNKSQMEEFAARMVRYKRSYLHARPAYATTCHKSQGSTWESVFVLQGDIAKNPANFERNRLLYVAYSRASKRLIVYGC